MNTPILTIAIPTFNRAEFLKLNLNVLSKELMKVSHFEVELIVLDNSDNNKTELLVQKYNNLNIKYIKNKENMGSDFSIAKSFDVATGEYVHIFGDDDFYVENTLPKLLAVLKKNKYGMVF